MCEINSPRFRGYRWAVLDDLRIFWDSRPQNCALIVIENVETAAQCIRYCLFFSVIMHDRFHGGTEVTAVFAESQSRYFCDGSL